VALERLITRAIFYGIPAALTDGPAARWIRGWSPAVARVAWATLPAGVLGLCAGGFATARDSARLSTALTVAGLVLAYAAVFVQQVRADTHRDRERATLRFSSKGHRRRPGI
jgi:hypothetical protein